MRLVLSWFCIVVMVTFFNYVVMETKRDKNAQESLKAVEGVMVASLEQVEKIMIFIGQRIVNDAPDLDSKKIHKIFVQYSDPRLGSSLLSWSLFDWANIQGYQTINTFTGPTRNHIYLAGRNYNNANDPWKLILSEVDIGNSSKQLIIPVGVQVENNQQKRVGTVTAGINLKKFVNIINGALDKQDRFLVIDNRSGKVAFDREVAGETMIGNNRNAPLETEKGNIYVAAVSLQNYPYTILTGYNLGQMWFDILFESARQIMIISSIVLLVAMLGGNDCKKNK